jgi:hypothetical protein
MNLSDHVCSLELATRLKELGVKQESMFSWFHCSDGSYELDYGLDGIPPLPDEYISAFTVSELDLLIPTILRRSETEADIRAKKLINVLELKNGLR